MEEARHSRMLTAWFHLYETLENVHLWRQEAEQWFPGARGRRTGMRHRELSEGMEMFHILTVVVTQCIHFCVNWSTLIEMYIGNGCICCTQSRPQ